MPLVDFHCAACNAVFETLVRSSEEPLCPQCGGTRLVRLIGNTAPPPRSGAIIKSGRAAAAREGHLSNFSKAERGK